ncbi:MAG: RsmB/NOP family class I SAM-dependent RNA methyltransferase [Pseudomonadota bacterium]
MTPPARVSAAIQVLDEIIAGAPAEKALTGWARASRFAGSRDRAAVRDLVFDVLRRRRSVLWRSGQGRETGRALLAGLLVDADAAGPDLFDGSPHAPAPLTAAETGAFRPLQDAPDAVRLDIPDFLEPALRASLGAAFETALAALQARADVHLRVNTLKARPRLAIDVLASDGIGVRPLPAPATALTVTENPRKVSGSAAYRQGLVELQDAASQIAAAAAGAAPGMTVLDLCAGGGGKTLALGAAMEGKGKLFAYDLYPARMKSLPERAARAGLDVRCLDRRALPRILGACDLVFVDAPCSGTGSWRRSPDAKWRLTPSGLANLVTIQKKIFTEALSYLRPGGHMIYATCSILAEENQGVLRDRLAAISGLTAGEDTVLLPSSDHDGFFYVRVARDGRPARG